MGREENAERKEIQEYYRKRATASPYATSPDFNLREVEIDYLQRWLKDGLSVLDVGCGNGYSTLCHASAFASKFTGIDFVPDMVRSAAEMKSGFRLKGSADFMVGDATQLSFPDESFDVVISERCLLNLPTRQDQWKAMEEVARVLKKGGRYLMLEGTLQGLRKLNTFREEFALAPIPEAESSYNWFSNKFDEAEMLEKSKQWYSKVETIQRFGMYYLISRIVHPLLVLPAQPKYDAEINKVARQLCHKLGDYEGLGHVALFVLQR